MTNHIKQWFLDQHYKSALRLVCNQPSRLVGKFICKLVFKYATKQALRYAGKPVSMGSNKLVLIKLVYTSA